MAYLSVKYFRLILLQIRMVFVCLFRFDCYCCFEMWSHVAQANLELTRKLRMVLNSCLCLLSTEISRMCHHT